MDTLTHHIWIGLAGGLLAFAHCLGMCGGFALHLSRGTDRRRMLSAQLLWHAGRLCSYLLMGAVAGFAGAWFQLFFLRHGLWQNLLGYLAAGAMFLTGLSLLGLLPVRGGNEDRAPHSLAAVVCGFFSPSSSGGALAMGIVTGFLPCPIILAFIAYSLQTGSVPGGMATMGALALGTSLPLLTLGGAARLTGWHLRSWAPRAGGAILVILAVSTALRGSPLLHRLLGCPPGPALHQGASPAKEPSRAGTPNGHCPGN